MKLKDILLIILTILCVFLFLDRSCINKKLYKAEGAYDQQKKVTEKSYKEANKEKKKHETEKRQLQEEIKTLAHSIQTKDEGDVGKKERLEELESEKPKLIDKDEIIENVERQNTLLREQLASALFTIEKLGKPIFSLSPTGEIKYPKGSITYKLNQKYLEQVSITDVWIKQFNDEKALRLSAENLAKDAIKEAGRLKLGSKLKTGGVAVLAGVLIYSLVKK